MNETQDDTMAFHNDAGELNCKVAKQNASEVLSHLERQPGVTYNGEGTKSEFYTELTTLRDGFARVLDYNDVTLDTLKQKATDTSRSHPVDRMDDRYYNTYYNRVTSLCQAVVTADGLNSSN